MKTRIVLLVCFLSVYSPVPIFPAAPSPAFGSTGVDSVDCPDRFYLRAFFEIRDMIIGHTAPDYKRAVFLMEWAYLGGQPDYDRFSAEIRRTAEKIEAFVRKQGADRYRTGRNYGLWEYLFRPHEMNGYKPFVYDPEDCGGQRDFTKLFVLKLMRTHSGQCRSLPALYKILADELGAEAFVARAPQHYFIMHRDEQGRMINLETTSGAFPTDAFFIGNFEISDQALRNRLYLHPMEERESIAYVLTEMLYGYVERYGYHDFIFLCADFVLAHFPTNLNGLFLRGNAINEKMREFAESGMDFFDPCFQAYDAQWKENARQIARTGFTEMSEEKINRLQENVDRLKDRGASPTP